MRTSHRRDSFSIGGRRIAAGEPCFVIAEAGVNHNGDLEMALKMVDVAAAAGADAVKFQTFNAESLATETAPKAGYQAANTDPAESQLTMLRRLELSERAHREIAARCQERGIVFLSTAFDEPSAEFLNHLGVVAFKIPSGELTNIPFLQQIARYGRPLIVSTGMACLGEVETACSAISSAGNHQFALLHCVSSYPAQAEDVNLRAINTLSAAFAVPVGYSDHTRGLEVPFAAVALGACIIEKHFTLDRHLPGPDQQVSLEPKELTELVRGIRSVEAAMGDGLKIPTEAEKETASVSRKSLIAATDIPAEAILSREMVAIKRPGTGLAPAMLDAVIGRKTRRTISAGELITMEALI
jgi:N,N'-diacetyllegionaminate synthase